PKVLAFALGSLAVCDMLLADYDQAEAEAREAIAISRASRLSHDVARFWGLSAALNTQASVRAMRGDDPAAALAWTREAMSAAEARGNPWELGMTAMNAARLASFLGDYQSALALSERSKAEFERA